MVKARRLLQETTAFGVCMQGCCMQLRNCSVCFMFTDFMCLPPCAACCHGDADRRNARKTRVQFVCLFNICGQLRKACLLLPYCTSNPHHSSLPLPVYILWQPSTSSAIAVTPSAAGMKTDTSLFTPWFLPCAPEIHRTVGAGRSAAYPKSCASSTLQPHSFANLAGLTHCRAQTGNNLHTLGHTA